MKFNVKITKILEGHVEIEAENYMAALSAAEQLYDGDGAELPDMDDSNSLMFSIDQPGFQFEEPKVIIGKPSVEDVRNYLVRQGYPDPAESLLDEFLNGGEDQEMYDEAVRENYGIIDVDRWFHVKNILNQPISFDAAMMIDNTLWLEEYELKELKSASQIFDTPEHICQNRIQQLVDIFNNDGTVVPNEFDVRDQDVIIFAKAFDLPIKLPEAQKASLSSLIDSAENRVVANEPNVKIQTKAPEL